MSAPLTVLLVDDESHVRKLISLVVRGTFPGAQVVEADSRDGAMREFAARLPGLVLLDINLVGESGLDILRDIRALDERGPVVKLTSVNVRHTVEEALAAGASGYLLKDATTEEMADVLRETVAGKPTDNP